MNDVAEKTEVVTGEPIEAPRQMILEILPNPTGFDVKVGDGITMTEAAKLFVEALIKEGKLTWNPHAPKTDAA